MAKSGLSFLDWLIVQWTLMNKIAIPKTPVLLYQLLGYQLCTILIRSANETGTIPHLKGMANSG